MTEQKTDAAPRCTEQQLVLLFRYHGTLWTRCRMRKDMPCENGGIVRAGKWGYRPLTNSTRRMMRLRGVPRLAQIIEMQNKGATGADEGGVQ